MGFVRGVNGNLMRGSDGLLATCSRPCACDPDCPTCCIKLTGGALIDGVIHYIQVDGENTIEYEITTQSGTRTVCDDETITITIHSPGTITFDPAWEYVGSSPVADDFYQYPGGYVYWDPLNHPATGDFSVILKMRTCFFYSHPSLGPVTITADVVTDVVGVTICTTNAPCCTLPWECSPCCWSMLSVLDGSTKVVNFVPPFDWHWNDELFRWEHLEFSNGVWFLFWIKPPDQEHPTLYCQNEQIQIGLSIGSEDSLLLEQITSADPGKIKVTFTIGEFELVPSSPIPASGTLVDGTKIVWEQENSLEYEAYITFNCDNPGQDQIDLQVLIDLDGDTIQSVGDPAANAAVKLEECEKENINGCPCGCPCCGGDLPDTITVEWTYNDIDYSFDLAVAGQDSCGENWSWWLIQPTFENMFPNCGPCGVFVGQFGLLGCLEFALHNINVQHICNVGWVLYLYTESGTNVPLSMGASCELPASLTHCGVLYKLLDGT